MGLLRLLLALAVVASHSGRIMGLPSAPGGIAVEALFVISGFYMALVLTERYQGAVGAFYRARFLRLFPMYWLVLAMTIMAALTPLPRTSDPLAYWQGWGDSLDPWTIAGAIAANILLVGQDVFRFLGIDANGGLAFDPALNADRPAAGLMVLPQAWTLGVEITFYALAPLLAKLKTRTLVIMCVASLVSRDLIFKTHALGPWVYFLFPFEVGLFLLGMLAYRIGRRLDIAKPGIVAWSALALIAAATEFGSLTEWTPRFVWLYLLALTAALPPIFAATRRSRIDDWIGQLSYPLYVVHFFVISFVTGPQDGNIAAIVSIAAAVLLVVVTAPLERRRHIATAAAGARS
jgi:peptidoglycan/LPS O-acetylase OafA/YrhL